MLRFKISVNALKPNTVKLSQIKVLLTWYVPTGHESQGRRPESE